MSHDPNDPNSFGFPMPDGEQPQNWQDMMRAIFGDAAAEDIEKALNQQGLDPLSGMGNILSGKNFTLITQQIQSMLGSHSEGPVNWKICEQVARETITSKRFDQLTASEGDAAREALRTASFWLDTATDFYPAQGPSMAWTRLDFVAHALPTLRKLLEPVGENISRAFSDTFNEQLDSMPEEMRMMFGNPAKFMGNITATMIGVQYGSALAELADRSFGSTDAALPLTEGTSAALIPSNVAEFSADLEVAQRDVLLYIAARESAASRLYSRVPWLRSTVLDTVAAFARDIQIDTQAIEEQLRESLGSQEPITTLDLSSVFTLELTDHQEKLLARLEYLLSLVEGWVAHVSLQAVTPHLPDAIALREMLTRRYATDNPGRAMWESQLGMQLTPKSVREAEAFWQMADIKIGTSKRDALWAHPDILPTPELLAAPEKFFEKSSPSDIEAELDSFLEDLFNEADGSSNEE